MKRRVRGCLSFAAMRAAVARDLEAKLATALRMQARAIEGGMYSPNTLAKLDQSRQRLVEQLAQVRKGAPL